MANELTIVGPTSNLRGGTIYGALIDQANITTSTMNGGAVQNATHNGLTISTSTGATLTPLGGAVHTLAASTGTVADVDVAQSFTNARHSPVRRVTSRFDRVLR